MRIPTFNEFQNQVDVISKEFDSLGKFYYQASTGKKLQRSSDDPVLAGQIRSLTDHIQKLNSYSDNQKIAQSRNSLFSISIQNSVNTLTRINEQIKKAQTGTLDDTARKSLAIDLQGSLTTLLSVANAQDAQGKYIFSGASTDVMPYAKTASGYVYQGALGQTCVEINAGSKVLYNESGFNVFGDIYAGNGTFTIDAGSGNTGSAFASLGSVTDAAGYIADTYTVTLVTNSSNQLAYQIVGASSGQVIPAPPATIPDDAPQYVSGKQIGFNGLTFNISGDAKVGDTFTVQPSAQQNIFDTVQKLITLLSNPVSNKGVYDQQLSQAAGSFNQAVNHIVTYQSGVGTRSAAVDTEVKTSQAMSDNQANLLSNLSDVDIVQVYTAFSQQSLILQATQQSYLKMQETLSSLMQMNFR